MQSSTATPTTFYRLPKVREICGNVSAATVWAWAKNSDKTGFPRPIRLSSNVTAWDAAQVEAWAQARIAASRAQLDVLGKTNAATPGAQQANKPA